MQEVVELVVFGLIAVLVGTGVLWLVGWLIGLLGSLFMWIAGILWLVLRYIVPVFVILGAVYYLFKLLQNRNSGANGSGSAKREPVVSGPRPGGASSTAPAAAPVTTPPQTQGLPYNPGEVVDDEPKTHEVKPLADGPVIVSDKAPADANNPDLEARVTEVEIVDPGTVRGNPDDEKKS